MARKKVEKNLSPLHRADEAAPKVPTDAAFRAPCFGEQDEFWNEAERFRPKEETPEVTIMTKEEEEETSIFKPASVLPFPIERGSVPWSPIAYESYSSVFEHIDSWTSYVLKEHREVLEKIDLLGAVRSTKGFSMTRNKEVLEVLLPRWNAETHTFVFS